MTLKLLLCNPRSTCASLLRYWAHQEGLAWLMRTSNRIQLNIHNDFSAVSVRATIYLIGGSQRSKSKLLDPMTRVNPAWRSLLEPHIILGSSRAMRGIELLNIKRTSAARRLAGS